MPANKQHTVSALIVFVPLLTALTAVGSFIKIPVPPVPITLQTLFVYLSGTLLGAKKGAASQVLFLIIGLIGIPVFGTGGGPAYVLQPGFGYLLGFPAAAWCVGRITEKTPGKLGPGMLVLSGTAGLLAVMIPGSVYLYFNMNYIIGTTFSLQKTLLSGIAVFLPGEILKLAAAAVITNRLAALRLVNEGEQC